MAARARLLAWPPALRAPPPGARFAALSWSATPVLSVLVDNVTETGGVGYEVVEEEAGEPAL